MKANLPNWHAPSIISFIASHNMLPLRLGAEGKQFKCYRRVSGPLFCIYFHAEFTASVSKTWCEDKNLRKQPPIIRQPKGLYFHYAQNIARWHQHRPTSYSGFAVLPHLTDKRAPHFTQKGKPSRSERRPHRIRPATPAFHAKCPAIGLIGDGGKRGTPAPLR